MSKRSNDKDNPPFVTSVIHATDFSAASERAFAHALAIALLREASLTLLHVTDAAQSDWTDFPAVRGTLERWGLLEPGSSRAAVFDKFGVQVKKTMISSRVSAAGVVGYIDTHPADL